MLPLARETSAFNFLLEEVTVVPFPGFYGKQASEIKAKPGTIWSMMSPADSGLKMSIRLNNVIRFEHFQSYIGPRSLVGNFNRCACKWLPLQRGELGISLWSQGSITSCLPLFRTSCNKQQHSPPAETVIPMALGWSAMVSLSGPLLPQDGDMIAGKENKA